MRIMQVVGPATGGLGAHVGRLSADLRAEGHEVLIVTAGSTAEHFGWAEALRLWPLGSARALVGAPVDWHRIMRAAGSVDVVHAHGHQAGLVAAVAVARARPRPCLVITLHNDLPIRSRGVRAISWALRRADLVTGASDDLAELARRLGARRVELSAVPTPRLEALLAEPPVTEGHRREARQRLATAVGIETVGITSDSPLVLTVSRIAPQKDLGTLVEAARRSHAGATWVVVGGGDAALRADLESRRSGIPLTFVGARDDVEDWLRAADVLVLTSRWEARALVVQEAMAAGVPVVAPAVGGLPGLVGTAGVLVPPGDPEATARSVDALLADPERAASIVAAARAAARTWDPPAAQARRWVARYAALTES
jgi:glycosyltransferase involved in cell wall biosynthesis